MSRPVFKNFDLQVTLPKLRALTKPELGTAVGLALKAFNLKFITLANVSNGSVLLAERAKISAEECFGYGLGIIPEWVLGDLEASSRDEVTMNVLDLPQSAWVTLLISENFLDEVPETIKFD